MIDRGRNERIDVMYVRDLRLPRPHNIADFAFRSPGIDRVKDQTKLVSEVVSFDFIIVPRVRKHIVTVVFQELPLGKSNCVFSSESLIEIMNQKDSHRGTDAYSDCVVSWHLRWGWSRKNLGKLLLVRLLPIPPGR